AQAGVYELERGGDLWRLLVTITLHKISDQVKYHPAAKRSAAADHGFGTEDSLHRLDAAACAREPSPAEAAALIDEVDHLMHRLTSMERQIVELRLQGHTLYEIADKADRSVTTVARILDRVKELLGGPAAGGTG